MDEREIKNLALNKIRCPFCEELVNFEVKTSKPLSQSNEEMNDISFKCDKCGTEIKKYSNAFYIVGECIGIDKDSITIKSTPAPPNPPKNLKIDEFACLFEHNLIFDKDFDIQFLDEEIVEVWGIKTTVIAIFA